MLRRFAGLVVRIPKSNNAHCRSRYNGFQIQQIVMSVAEQDSRKTMRRLLSTNLQTRYQELLHPLQQNGVKNTEISEEGSAVESFFEDWGTHVATGTVSNPSALEVVSMLDRLDPDNIRTEHHISAVAQQLAHDYTMASARGLEDLLGHHSKHLSPEGLPKLCSILIQILLRDESRRSTDTTNTYMTGLRRLMNRYTDIQLDIPTCRLLTQYYRREKPTRIWEQVMERHLRLGTEDVIVDIPCFMKALESLHTSPSQAQQMLDALIQARQAQDGWDEAVPSVSTSIIAKAVVHVLRNYHGQLVNMIKSNKRIQWTQRRQERFSAPAAKLFRNHQSTLLGSDADAATEQLLSIYAIVGDAFSADTLFDDLTSSLPPPQHYALLLESCRDHPDRVVRILKTVVSDACKLKNQPKRQLIRDALRRTTVSDGQLSKESKWIAQDPHWAAKLWDHLQDGACKLLDTNTIRAFLDHAVRSNNATLAESVVAYLPQHTPDDWIAVLYLYEQESVDNEHDEAETAVRVAPIVQRIEQLHAPEPKLLATLQRWSENKHGSVAAARMVDRLVTANLPTSTVANALAVTTWSSTRDERDDDSIKVAVNGMMRVFERCSEPENGCIDKQFGAILLRELSRIATPLSTRTAVKVLGHMEKTEKVQTETVHYDIVQQGLLEAGLMKSAVRFVDKRLNKYLKRMQQGAQPDSGTFRSLMKSWAKTNDKEHLILLTKFMNKWANEYIDSIDEEGGPDELCWEMLGIAWSREETTSEKISFQRMIRDRARGIKEKIELKEPAADSRGPWRPRVDSFGSLRRARR